MRKILMASSALLLFSTGMSVAQDQVDPEIAQGNCVQVEPGTGEFEASDANDDPNPGFVDTVCPEGMVPRDGTATGSIRGDDSLEPGTGQFEPTNRSDEPTPDFVEPGVGEE